MIEYKLCGVIGDEVDVNTLMSNWDQNAAEVQLTIDSQGGSVYDGFRLYDHIMNMRAKGQKITAKVIGECYSIASVIACACTCVIMNKYALWMIHCPTVSIEDATSEDLRKTAEVTDKISDNIAQIYAERTGKTKEEMLSLMQATAFFNTQEAQTMGFIDKIYHAFGEIKNKWSGFKMVAQSTEAEKAAAEAKVAEIQKELATETEVELPVCEKCGKAHEQGAECQQENNMEIEEQEPAIDWKAKFEETQACMVKMEAEFAALRQSQAEVCNSADLKLKNLAGKIETPARESTGKQPVATNRF